MGKKVKEEKATITSMVQGIIDAGTEALKDAEKFDDKGNASAGTRVRKAMQEIKNLAQATRLAVSEAKASE